MSKEVERTSFKMRKTWTTTLHMIIMKCWGHDADHKRPLRRDKRPKRKDLLIGQKVHIRRQEPNESSL